MIACILALYFMQAGLLASRLYVVLFGCLALLSIYAVRYILLKLLKATHTLTKPVILIGAGKTAEQVLHFFDGDLGYRYEVIGILDDHPISKTLPQQFQLMGTLADAETIIRCRYGYHHSTGTAKRTPGTTDLQNPAARS